MPLSFDQLPIFDEHDQPVDATGKENAILVAVERSKAFWQT